MGISLPTPIGKVVSKRIARFYIALAFGLTVSIGASAQNGSVGIGTTTPSDKAILHIASNSKGLLIPRLTTAERNTVLAPNPGTPVSGYNGLLIYNTDENAFNVWKDDNWVAIGGAAGANGTNGLSVAAAAINGTGQLELTLSDGVTVITATGTAKGDKGDKGVTWFSGTSDLANNPASATSA